MSDDEDDEGDQDAKANRILSGDGAGCKKTGRRSKSKKDSDDDGDSEYEAPAAVPEDDFNMDIGMKFIIFFFYYFA